MPASMAREHVAAVQVRLAEHDRIEGEAALTCMLQDHKQHVYLYVSCSASVNVPADEHQACTVSVQGIPGA